MAGRLGGGGGGGGGSGGKGACECVVFCKVVCCTVNRCAVSV